MRALVQRVTQAEVVVSDTIAGQCEEGLMILVCAMKGDTDADAEQLAKKIAKLRIFRDEEQRMNLSILDIKGSALVVSQFTLAADTRRGNRPGFSGAAAPDEGRRLYELFADCLSDLGVKVETGVFGADMAVTLTNDGPVTIWLDTRA